MAKFNQEVDYFVPTLAPYVQWVLAYRQLICSLYGEHKTVRRTWKAFRDAIPGVEQRLEFGVFEQILLFSLFISEWSESDERNGSIWKDHEARRGDRNVPASHADNQLDTVIQELRNASNERDRALWNVKHLEENVARLTALKDDLEMQVKSLTENLGKVSNEFNAVIHELDAQRTETACLLEKNAAMRDNEASLEEQIKRLLEKPSGVGPDKLQHQNAVAVKKAKDKQGPSQTAIWVRQAAGLEVVQDPDGKISAKNIAGWNVQRAKDGYYRVYRKIRGRVHSIYIGRELDIEKANRRIAQKEKELE